MISAHEPTRIPRGHLERIDYQIVDFTHKQRVLSLDPAYVASSCTGILRRKSPSNYI